eukprot:scaffold905_cov223-Alexandrium_tamarense.AAC.15
MPALPHHEIHSPVLLLPSENHREYPHQTSHYSRLRCCCFCRRFTSDGNAFTLKAMPSRAFTLPSLHHMPSRDITARQCEDWREKTPSIVTPPVSS